MAAVQLAPPLVHRPSMDRSSSFESSRRTFTSTYDRSTSPIPRQTYSPSPLGNNPHASQSHSRTNSNASSPYNQPFTTNYFTQPNFHPHAAFPHTPPLQAHSGGQIGWTASPIPATAFYSASMAQNGGPSTGGAPGGTGFTYPGQVFHQGFQQSQADFAAWAHAAAYQHMVMASVQQQQQQHQQQEFLVGQYGEEDSRRRTNSGPVNPQPQVQHPYQRRQSLDDRTSPPLISTLLQQPRSVSDKHPQQPQVGGFHPYKRNPGPTHRPSKESLRTNQQPSVIPRSRSQPSLSTTAGGHPGERAAASIKEHQRTPSLDSSLSGSTVQAGPRLIMADDGRRDSSSRERGRKVSIPPAQSATLTTAPSPIQTPPATLAASAAPTARSSAPLQSGPIASATNTQNRPSPLAPTLPSTPSEKSKPANGSSSGGLKSRLAKALHKDKVARDNKSSMPPPTPTPPTPPTPSKSIPHISPSETSTRSGTPPRTPPHPHAQDSFNPQPPSAPFAMIHRMGSEVSLAETGRTERVQDEGTEKKGKRGLFRMKNMSTDNISLSSTVSSASMMIRKMGSIGKLARRNSLMGISKIFKDKPKDEDAALPETDGVVLSKKDKKEKEKREKEEKKKAKAQQKGKGDPAPTAIVRASAEAEDDDRALAGLSPAAKLARQHTLKSRADEAKRLSQVPSEEQGQGTGEPTWDNNTVTRPSTLPSLGSVLPPMNHQPGPSTAPAQGPGTEVMLVQPRNTSAATVHHAVNVSEAEYDSEDDSSDGEDMEDLAYRLKGSKMSDEADKEFRSIWGNSYIDKRAVPKKGILKAASFYDDTPKPSRAGSATGTRGGVLAEISPNGATSPETHSAASGAVKSKSVTLDFKPHTQSPPLMDFDFSFDTPSPSLDLHHPQANSSAHSLPSSPSSKPAPGLAVRSMTSPVPPRRILWAPDCAVYTTYDSGTYDRRSEPATCNRLTPELALSIKQELNAFKLEMPVHPASRKHTHYFA